SEWTPERMKRWALKIGTKTAEFIETLIKSRAFAQQSYRACLGVLRLGKRFGEARLEKACAKALLLGMTRYQEIESLLKENLEAIPIFTYAPVAVVSHHDNIRGPAYYQ
ncbi:MAG: IS21 family transposase, partial [Saprospiraceae bacterium]|nr:IS21 family transposase [Saprospiraceae bacterium]